MHLAPLTPIPNSKGQSGGEDGAIMKISGIFKYSKKLREFSIVQSTVVDPFIGAFNTGGGKIGDFRPVLPFIAETVRVRPMVTMER